MISNLILSQEAQNSPSSLRQALLTFTRVAHWGVCPPEDAGLDAKNAWRIAETACKYYLKPEAVIYRLAGRKMGHLSFMAVIVEVPSDDFYQAGEHYFWVKGDKVTYMGVRGHATLQDALEYVNGQVDFYKNAGRGVYPDCPKCGHQVYPTTDPMSPYFRRCLTCNPPKKIA